VSGNSYLPDANAADQIPQRTNFSGMLTPVFSTVNGAPKMAASKKKTLVDDTMNRRRARLLSSTHFIRSCWKSRFVHSQLHTIWGCRSSHHGTIDGADTSAVPRPNSHLSSVLLHLIMPPLPLPAT
jgi:hypothetical protein